MPSPLQTYEAMNITEPVVTASVIQERLARHAEESPRPARKSGPLSEHRDESKRRAAEAAKDQKDGRENHRDKKRENFGYEKKERFNNFPKFPISKVPVPNIRAELSDDLEDEFEGLFQNEPLESLMANVDHIAGQAPLEDGTKVNGRIVSIKRDSVFVDLGVRDLGVIPLKQFPEDQEPVVGASVEAVVSRFNDAEGTYDVALPLAAAEVGDWSSITDGIIVEARITGANAGGLECEIGKLPAFMPIGQIATFRVENIEEFIGERWKCVVLEVNPARRNIVVSRRVLMEREREEMREKLMAELEVGQVREGLVRKLIDAGAFVDLGGVDGFIPISMMSWGRIGHPGEVLKEGERIKVTVQKIDTVKNRISLSCKDQTADLWNSIFDHFQEKTQARGRVTAIMPFGAFVELMPGVEGLVHISEIHHKRINNVSEALQIGDWVDVMILAIDQEKRKMSLSIKQLTPDPRIEEKRLADEQKAAEEAEKARLEDEEVEKVRERIRKNQHKGVLKGGIDRRDGQNNSPLNW